MIAYDRLGSGPPVVLVDGALCCRTLGPMMPIARQLAASYTVVAYDRRGRGESGDTPPNASAREVEDVLALVEAVGGTASLFGISSGAALAAVAQTLPSLPAGARVLTFCYDTGERYLSVEGLFPAP